MVAGLEEISGGTVSIGDRVVNDVAPKDRDIAMVFQNYALYPHMTVYKNMGFALKLRNYPKKEIDTRIREAAAILGLTELLERKPKALSGGQRQRVAVGRAIVRHPSVFLFDEPLSNLDAKLRVEMRAELKRLHQKLKTTTIYVTHDQEEAMTLGSRIVVMKDGFIHQVGSPLEVYNKPVNSFVAGFVGTPPMNFLTGRIGKDGGTVFFDEGTCKIALPDAMASKVADRIDQEVLLGLRPEGISLHADRFGNAGNIIPVKVIVTEPLGEKMDMFVSTLKHGHIVARVDADAAIGPDQQVNLHINMEKVHIFEPQKNGKNLTN
jgi:multiple sugar transport system ATP-binding protein